MKTWCERLGQVEVGVIEYEGRTFAALGASVQGRHVTGYTGLQRRDIFLSTWCGKTMLACRSEVIEEYHDGGSRPDVSAHQGPVHRRLRLGERGMLFRGELLSDCTDEEARRTARQIAEHFAELDSFDEYMASQIDEAV